MTTDQLFRFRSLITEAFEKSQLNTLTTQSNLFESAEFKPNGPGDDLDLAKEESIFNTRLELHNRQAQSKEQLLAALNRIRNGTYGLCSKCEEQIDLKRLEAHLTATQCLECQKQEENSILAKTHPFERAYYSLDHICFNLSVA